MERTITHDTPNYNKKFLSVANYNGLNMVTYAAYYDNPKERIAHLDSVIGVWHINWDKLPNICRIIEAKKFGHDCTENQSAEIKDWLRRTAVEHNSFNYKIFLAIIEYFPFEMSEFMEEVYHEQW